MWYEGESYLATVRWGSIGGLSPRGHCVQTATHKTLCRPTLPPPARLVACQSCDTAPSHCPGLFVSGWRDGGLGHIYLGVSSCLTLRVDPSQNVFGIRFRYFPQLFYNTSGCKVGWNGNMRKDIALWTEQTLYHSAPGATPTRDAMEMRAAVSVAVSVTL